MKLNCVFVAVCLPDYWCGHRLPHISVSANNETTLTQLKSDLKSELLQDAIMGNNDDCDDAWHDAAKEAIDAITVEIQEEINVYSYIEEGSESMAFFVFIKEE